MYTSPIWIVFIHNFAAGFLMTWLGLLLINIRIKIYKIGIAGLCYGTIAILLRNNIGLSFDISFILQLLALVVVIVLISNIGFPKSLLATVFGTVVLSSGEVVFTPLFLQLSGITIRELMNSEILTLLVPVPQISLTLSIIWLCTKKKFYLFDFNETGIASVVVSRNKRNCTISGLVLIQLIVILVQITFNVLAINQEYTIFQGFPLSTIGYLSSSILFVGVISMIFLIKQLVELIETESQYQAQSVYIETIDELYTAIRSERHDILNHLQTIYGFNQLGYTNEVGNYLNELLGGNVLSNDFIVTGTPGLTALLYIKSSVAKSNEIEFKVNVNQPIDNLKVSPYELNTILGNLINNAFDAVQTLEIDQRIVNIDMGADDDYYVFRVSNYGYIDDDLKEKIMKKGFSTKKGEHSGLGLHICKTLIKKYGGHMEIENGDDHMVHFTVFFVKNQESGKVNEFASQKNSPFAG